jgi:wyosine [tRNA(Phe)-imidazoG37] synthetase (radical SAM superfamily)
MSTSLFDDIVFGPIKSRRLGNSLGINLLPTKSKFCNFDCVYCECGWTGNNSQSKSMISNVDDIINKLIEKVVVFKEKKVVINSITFAGNGEPTLHPQFSEVVSDVILVRNLMLPESKVTILSNGTMLHKKNVAKTLKEVDHCILKLDAGSEELFRKINQPLGGITIEKILNHYLKLKGELTIQTLFFRGVHNGHVIDNTTEKEVDLWIKHLLCLNPKLVMLYSLDRPTPSNTLTAVSTDELNAIADKLKRHHIKTIVS